MLPYWNAYSFFTTYAAADGLTVEDLAGAPPAAERPEIDRWILSVLQSLVKRVNDEMEGYYLYNVIPPLIEFVDDLTNWYIRRSRRRFWGRHDDVESEAGVDTLAAFATLYDVLVTFAQLMAPVLPFVTEVMYQDLVVSRRTDGGPRSVHHEDYPEADESRIDRDLETAMDVVREVVTLGRSLRVQSKIKIRQPLSTLTVVSHDAAVRRAVSAHADLISDELNVKVVETSEDEQAHAHLSAKANFRVLGPRLGPRMKDVATAIAALDETAVASLIDGASLEVGGEQIGLDDVVVSREPRAGVEVASTDRMSAALDTTMTTELELEGLAREVVKAIQQLRRDAGLDVADRITVTWSKPSAQLRTALEAHASYIAGEVLADVFTESADLDPGDADAELVVEGDRVALSVRPV
jgi:isoleucyl-tRNA synthetase